MKAEATLKCSAAFRAAQQVIWRDTPVIDLVVEDAPEDEDAPTFRAGSEAGD